MATIAERIAKAKKDNSKTNENRVILPNGQYVTVSSQPTVSSSSGKTISSGTSKPTSSSTSTPAAKNTGTDFGKKTIEERIAAAKKDNTKTTASSFQAKSAAVTSATKTRSRDSGVRQAYKERLGTEDNTRAAKAEMDSAFSDYQSAIVRYEEAKKKYNPTTFADQPRNTSAGLEDSYREFFTAQEDVNRLKKQYEDKRTNYQRNLDAASERYLDQYSRPTTYTSDNLEDYFDRINQLASLDTWTDKQRKEAEEIYDIMRGGQFSSNLYQITKSDRFKPNYSAIAAEKSASGEWTPEQYLNYIELESRLGNKVHAKTAAAMTGFLQGIGATSLVDTVASLSGNEALKDSSGIMKETAAFGQKAAPGFYAAGSMAGNIALLSSLSNVAGEAIGGAMKGTSIAIKAAGTTLNITPQIIGAASNVVAFTAADAIQNAGALASGEMSGAEYALSLGRAALGSTAGSLAQGLASTGISVILKNRGLMTPLGEFARLTVSSIAHSGAYIGTDYALRKEKPSKEELATRFATAFAFSILNGAVSTYQNTKIATRNFENGLKQVQELYARMEQGAANMTPAERADLAKTIAGMTQEIRNGINSSYLAGQQENVNKLNGALDIIESSARQYADGFASARAATQYSGNILGETSAVTDTDIQDVLIDAVEGGLEPIQQGENGLTIQQAPETVANAPIETSAPLATAAANGIVLPTAQQDTPITLPGNTAGEITPAEDIEDNRIDLMTAEELENIRNAASETETAESAIANTNPAQITQEIAQENIPARADLPETVQTRTPNEEILWTAPKDNGGWKTQYNGDIPIYDALQITDRDLFNAFRAEGSGEGVRSTPIINAYIATWEDVRQGTISPMAAAQLLSAVYRSGGAESLASIYNPATGNLRPEALEAAKQLDIRHAEERTETETMLPRAEEMSISERRAELDRAYQNGTISAEDYANISSVLNSFEGGISNGESNITAGEPENGGEISLPDRYAGRGGLISERGGIEHVPEQLRIRGGTREHAEIVAQRLDAIKDQPFTSPEAVGFPYGTDTESIQRYPESIIDEIGDKEAQAALDYAYANGIDEVVLFAGAPEISNGAGTTTAQGLIDRQNRRIFARIDLQGMSLSEIIRHEVGHWLTTPENLRAFITSVTGNKNTAWEPVYKAYERVYKKVTNNYAGMTEERKRLYVWEEIMEDAFAKKNRYAVRAGTYYTEAYNALNNAETTPAAYPETQNTEITGPEETANTRGPPESIDLMTAEEAEGMQRFSAEDEIPEARLPGGEENAAPVTPKINHTDIEAIQSIGKKSVNDFTSQEIERSSAFARKYWAEMGIKSPFFRAWFGDWREQSNDPVSLPEIDLSAVVSSGNEINEDTGKKISWSKDAARESTLNASKDNKQDIRIISANMAEVVRKAVLLDTFVSKKDSNKKMPGTAFMHSFYTVAPVNGKQILVKLYAEEALSARSGDVFTRAYSLKYIEKVADIDNGVHSKGGLTGSPSATINTVADLFALVKKFDPDFNPAEASKIVNPDGTPKLMYRGDVNGNPNIFDRKKSRGSNLYGRGFYFTESEEAARQYGETGAHYLNVRNPISPGSNQIQEQQIRKFLEAVAENEDYSIENYGTYDVDEILNNITSRDAFNVIQDINATAIGDLVEAIELFNKINGTKYDGIVTPTETVVFDSKQIKSATDNTGTFDRNNPDVRFSAEDEEEYGISLPGNEESRLEIALEMLDNGAPLSDVYHETGLVVMANGNILNGMGGEVIGRYDNGRSNAGGIRGVREGIRSGEVYGGGNGAGLAENPQETRSAKGGDWRNLSANSRERITEATENHMAQATDDGKELYEAYASPEEFAERFYTMLQQGRVVAEQWRNYVPDIQGLMDEINDIVSTPDQNNPDIRFSAEDEEEKPARRTRKPVAESRPIIAKRDLKTNMLNLFSIPDGMRGQMGEVIDQYADRLLKNGSLTQADYDAFFDRMYAEGVMMQPAIDDFREARDMLTKSRIYVTEAQKHEFGDDWNDFRKRAFAAGIYLTSDSSERGPDAWNAELSQTLPGMFSADELDDRRILEQIVQIAEEGKDEKMSLAEYTALISAEGGVSEDEILDNMERQMDWALRTFAEKAKLEIKLRDRTGVKIAQERERAGQSAVRQRGRETASRQKERERRKEMAQRTKENRELRELQQRTLKQLQWLSRNSYRAPNDLKAAWDEVLGDIDIYAVGAANEMNYSKKYGATWRDLADMYKSARENDPNFLPSKELEKIKERLEGSHIGDMDIGALQDLYKMAVGLRTEFYNRNNVINDEQHRVFAEVYEDSKKELNEAKGGYTGKRLDRFFNTEQMTPINVLERMGGWDPDGTFFSMAKQLEKGERDMRAFKVKAEAQLKDFIDEHQDWLKTADGQGRNAKWYELEVPELLELGMGDKPIFGKSVKVYMTPVQKVHMYLESRNYDNLRHMVGGRTFANKELYSKGKRNEAFAQGTTVKLAPETVKKIVSDLTEEEMALANALDRYYNGFATENINKVSNALYGFDKAMGRNYAPIFTNKNYVTSELGVFDQTAEGVGNLKARVYSKNPSYNISALDAFEKNVEQTSRFVGMAIPARNWQTLLNWQERGNSMGDVLTHKWGEEGKRYIEDLITTLQAGRKDRKKILEGLTDTLLSNYVSAVFGANPGIVFKQAASFPQFASALGWINAPAPHQMIRVNEDLINTYSSELAYRKLGYATPETAQLKNNPTALQSNKTLRFLFGGGAIISMDAGTVKRGWVWAENKVRRENPELEIGTQEQIAAGESPFYKKVAEEFENAVSLTQPMYDEMHRADIMKHSSGIGRAFTMFKTVPLQQYNSMRRAFGEMSSAKQQRKNAGEGAREQANEKYRRAANKAAGTVTATIASVLMLEAVELLNNLLKNKAKRYRDDEGELTTESVSEEFLTRSAQDLAGMVIGGKELSEVLANWFMGEKWYGIEVPGGEQLNDFVESIGNAKNMIEKIIAEGSNILANGGDIEEYLRQNSADYAGAAKEIAEKLSMYLGGFPAENIEKYIMGSMQHISPELYTAMQDAFKNPTKSSLADLMGEALTTRVTNLLGNRNVEISEEAAAEIAALYEAGYKDAIPTDIPTKISVNSEERQLNAYQQQTYNTVWSGTVSGALEDLIGSDEYQAADDKTRAKMIDGLYTYAGYKAKKTLFDEYEPNTNEGAADRADYALAYGVDPALYMAVATITGGTQKQRDKIDALINLDASEFDKKILYNAIIGSKQENGDYVASKDEAINALWDAGLSFEQFLEAQYQYQTINAEDIKASEKAVALSRWVNSQKYTDEQAAVVRETLKYFAQIPQDDGQYGKFYDAGLDDETAYAASSALSKLEPEDGKKQVSDLQKMRAIIDTVDHVEEQLSAISAVVEDAAYTRLSIAHDFDIEPEAYVRAYEAMPEYDADGNGSYKQTEVRAMIEGITGGDVGGIVLPGGEYIYLSNDQKAVLWQLICSSSTAKNNPYSRRIGQQVIDAKASAKEKTAAQKTEEINSIALPEIVLPRG